MVQQSEIGKAYYAKHKVWKTYPAFDYDSYGEVLAYDSDGSVSLRENYYKTKENGYIIVEIGGEVGISYQQHFRVHCHRSGSAMVLYHVSSKRMVHADTDIIPVRKGDILTFGKRGGGTARFAHINVFFYPIAPNE